MKIIIFIFLSLLSLSADTIKIPQVDTTTENAKEVAKNGWNKAEKPLKIFIIKNGDTYVQQFLNEVKIPFKAPEIKGQVPKIVLTRDHYFYALSYAKYMEFNNQTDKSLAIYTAIIKGLKQVRNDEYAMIGLIYQIVIEKITMESVLQGFDNNIYSNSQKNKLYTFLEKNLILDENIECKELLLGIDTSKFVIPSINLMKSENVNLDVIYTKVCNRVSIKQKKYYKRQSETTSKVEIDNLEKEADENFFLLKKALDKLEDKSPDEINELQNDPENFIVAMTNIIYYVSLPKFGKIRLDFLDRIRVNKKFLEGV
jgi:hypothetical protein